MINIEKIINSLGKFISLMIPTMTILMIVIIVARYFLGIGLTGIQELVMYMHALIFLGCAGYVQYSFCLYITSNFIYQISFYNLITNI